MSILHTIILGIIQGVGEFLPISSSGHLVLIPYIFGWDYQGLNFDVALHFGTVLAILVFFWRDWIVIIASAISTNDRPTLQASRSNETQNPNNNLAVQQFNNYPQNLFWVILVASIPAAIAGYFLKDLAEHALRNSLLVAIFLAFFAIILWLADTGSLGKKKVSEIGYTGGFIVGIAQAIALFPGVSRSGVTTTAGMFLGLDRRGATRFSFLMATPVMIGAFLLTLGNFQFSAVNFVFIIAIATSAITGFFSIKYLLKFLERHSFLPFVIYRLALAALIIVLYFIR